MMTDDVRVALLTSPGRGAVATVLVAGAGATKLVQRHFQAASGQALDALTPDRIVFGRWGGAGGEEVVLRRLSDDRLEIHGHGGLAASAAIIDALVGSGARPADWRTSPMLLDINPNRADPIRADAVAALACAVTRRAADVLLDQYQGALRAELEAIRGDLVSHRLEAGGARLRVLAARSAFGLHLTSPWRVVLVGRPNVGKSSLLNALLGYRRAIIHDQPGTTRDVVAASTAIDGWSIELSDTAGLRESVDDLESAGIALSRRQVAVADLVLLVGDRSRPWTSQDDALLAAHPTALLVHNKHDLPPAGPRPAGLPVSALTGQGIDDLHRAIVDRLSAVPSPGAAVPFTLRQVESIAVAIAALQSDNPSAAIASIDGVRLAAGAGSL
jgi:tRNA modification GTPase